MKTKERRSISRATKSQKNWGHEDIPQVSAEWELFSSALPSCERNNTPILETKSNRPITLQELAKEKNLLKKEIKGLKDRVAKIETKK